ncbi:MAG TPA: hypothetical protein VEJ16_02895 [Alphaproteobacteria bacterium]|nr:hypothetical protein [Alphaproteobacteria bacterium]
MRSFTSPVLFTLGIAAAVAGCSPTSVVLRQPETGQIAECVSIWSQFVNVFGDVDSCTQTFLQQRYVQQTP